ncbi:hypothetical protein ACN47E_007342 [Coniothyrium glycines]
MTFGTGAVGQVHEQRAATFFSTGDLGMFSLDLATADRIFIVEPQWNSSVEDQAIAHALRLDLKQALQVTRYLVERTVEQDMRALQKRKLEISDIAKFRIIRSLMLSLHTK